MIVVLDTETTGLDREKDRVVEIAVAEVSVKHKALLGYRASLVNPGRSIPAEASGVHHLIAEDVKDAPWLQETYDWLLPEKAEAYAAHNAAFDRAFLEGLPELPWICTYKCAQTVWPDAPSYGNQTLRYFLKLELPKLEGRGSSPHSALYDAVTTAGVLIKLLGERTVAELVEISSNPVLLRTMPFGKYRGEAFKDVPKDYMRWLNRQTDLGEDLKHTLEYYLA